MSESQTIQYPVLDMQGKQVGTIELNPQVFAVEPKPWLVHEVVRWQRAKRRAGTHSAKNRSFIKRGNTKPFKQKGTGRARQGSSRSPLMVGGSVVHGPSPRSYEFRLAKRSRRQALANVLSDKARSNSLIVIDDIQFEKPSTKGMMGVLKAIGVTARKWALVSPEKFEAVEKSLRNIPGSLYMTPGAANVYDLVCHQGLVITKSAVEGLERKVLGTKEIIGSEQ